MLFFLSHQKSRVKLRVVSCLLRNVRFPCIVESNLSESSGNTRNINVRRTQQKFAGHERHRAEFNNPANEATVSYTVLCIRPVGNTEKNIVDLLKTCRESNDGNLERHFCWSFTVFANAAAAICSAKAACRIQRHCCLPSADLVLCFGKVHPLDWHRVK